MILELLQTFLIFLLSVIIWQVCKKPSNYPPGPWGLPLIGSIPAGLEGFLIKLEELKKKHNDLISWRIGTKLIVVMFDYKLVKEVYTSPDFMSRPNVKTLTYLHGDEVLGIICSTGSLWRKNRRFALKQLRDFGMGKSKLVSVANHEAQNFVNELQKCVGTPTSVPHSLNISLLNITWQLVGSQRFDLDDADINKFVHLVSETQKCASKLIILDVYPWITKILPQILLDKLFNLNIQMELSNQIKTYFRKYIDEHIKDFDEHNIRDYIDAYLADMKNQEVDSEPKLSIENLIYCLSDLFEGATETTDMSIHWAILYLAKFPQIQTRLQSEIDEMLPKGTPFAMDDKPRLPYTEAFIHELLRYSSITPGAPRAALVDTKIGNYFIPKGAFIILQSQMIQFDPKYFDSPKEFRPERFLDSDGKFSPIKEGFAPFGLGNRVCIGESIARMELFVFLTKLVQNFHFEYPPGGEFNLESTVGIFFVPPKGSPKVVITPR